MSNAASNARGRTAVQKRARRKPSRSWYRRSETSNASERTSSMAGVPARCASTSSCTPGTTSRAWWSIACSAWRQRSARSTRPALRTSSPSACASAMAAVEAPVPPALVTVTTMPRHVASAGSGAAATVLSSARGIARESLGECGQQRVATEVGLEQRGGAEGEPVASHAPIVDDQDRRARASRRTLIRSRSTSGRDASATSAENTRRDASRARTSSADTHLMNSAGIDAEFADCASAANHGERACPSPRRTKRSDVRA